MKFDSDMFEHDHLVAAKVLKVKMMMAFRILDDLCQEQYVKRWHCGDVNREAYELAKSMASKEVNHRVFYYFYTKPVKNQAILTTLEGNYNGVPIKCTLSVTVKRCSKS